MAGTRLSTTQRALAVGLVLCVSLVAFEMTAVITALPTITEELDGLSLYGITIAAYMIADLVALVWSSEWADRFGVRRPFLLCMAAFILGLLVAASVQSMVVVVAGRLLQGAGSGGFAPLSYIAVRRAFPEDRQPTMYVWLSAGWVLPSLIAPAVSGIVTDHWSWRWVFLGIVPLALVVTALTARAMSTLARPEQGVERRPSRLRRAVQVAGGVAIVAIASQSHDWYVALPVAIAGALIAAPALRQLLPSGVFRARAGLPAVIAVRMLATAAFLGIDSFIPLAADRLHGAKPIIQGFVIAGAAVAWTGGQAVVARRKPAPRRAVAFGFTLLLTGAVAAAPVLSPDWPLILTFVGWTIGGFGMGYLFNPTTVSAMSYADDGREGEIGGQIHLADSLGFGLMSIVGGATVTVADHSSFTLQAALAVNFTLAAICALLGLVASRGVRARAGRGPARATQTEGSLSGARDTLAR